MNECSEKITQSIIKTFEKNMGQRLTLAIFTLIFCLAICAPVRAAWRVAIFDYDDRLAEPGTVAKYLETQLRNAEPEIDIEQYSGKGNRKTAVTTVKQLERGGYDLIITITSDALILAHHFLKNTPTLYTNVNNPLSLGVMTLDAPGRNMSGASYYVPIAEQIAFFTRIQPNLQKVGFLFDENNRASKSEIAESRSVCHTKGLQYAIRLVTNAEELPQAVEALVAEGVEAVIVTSSEFIYSNVERFKSICDRRKIPIYSYNKKAVEAGAIAALASDHYRMAKELIVPMALRVLREQVSPGTMPAAFLREKLMVINRSEADKLEIKIPDDILRQATTIY